MAEDHAERLVTPAQYDAEIKRLQQEAAVATSVIDDPVQRNRRHRKRALLVGLAMTAGSYGVPEDLIKRVRSIAGDSESALWPEVLEADGWKKEADGIWKMPGVKIPDEEPPEEKS